MNTKLLASLVALAIGCLGASTGWAQAGAHIMVTPTDLKWADVPSLPAGAKIAVIEGPLTEAVPFTFRLKFPADYKIPAHWHPKMKKSKILSKHTPVKQQALTAASRWPGRPPPRRSYPTDDHPFRNRNLRVGGDNRFLALCAELKPTLLLFLLLLLASGRLCRMPAACLGGRGH